MISLARSIQQFHGRKYLVEPAYEQQLKELGIYATMDWVNYSGGQIVSDSPTTRCRRVSTKDGSAYYFKRYICPTQRGIQFWMRPGKAAVEVWAYQKLVALGIPTIEIVAFGEQRVLGILKSAFMVSRAVPDSQNLEDFALNRWHQMSEPLRRKTYNKISHQLAHQIRTAHKGRFFHHDLKWRNILVRREESGNYSTVWIDAPRASTMLFRQRRGVIVDLAGLARLAVSLLSTNDRMRFICKYLGQERRPGDAKHLYKEVAKNLNRRPPEPISPPPRCSC